jgi:hypothetical protein
LLNGLVQNFLLGRLGYFFIFLNHRDIFYLKELFKKTNSAAMAASRKEQRPNSSKWAGPVPRTRTGGHLDRSPSGDDDARMIDRTGELSLAAAACHPSRARAPPTAGPWLQICAPAMLLPPPPSQNRRVDARMHSRRSGRRSSPPPTVCRWLHTAGCPGTSGVR